MPEYDNAETLKTLLQAFNSNDIGALTKGLHPDVRYVIRGRSQVSGTFSGLEQMAHVADFWLWLYLIFAVSNAMLPSESDMYTVRPVLLFLGMVAAVVLLVSGVPAIPPSIVQGVSNVAGYLASAFGLTLAVDLLFLLLIGMMLWITRWAQGE